MFLVDRHNRGELNLSKLGVVGDGRGGEPRRGLGRLARRGGLDRGPPHRHRRPGPGLPDRPEGAGINLAALMNSLAPRIPLLLMAGERDVPSHEAIKKVRGNVEKVRLNRVELFPSSLHGYKLLKLEPRAASVIVRFLDGHTKLKSTEWEPRFNLNPVNYTDIEVVRHAKSPADKEKEKEKVKLKAKDAPAKAKEPPADRKDDAAK